MMDSHYTLGSVAWKGLEKDSTRSRSQEACFQTVVWGAIERSTANMRLAPKGPRLP
jgi:hypothetical protein